MYQPQVLCIMTSALHIDAGPLTSGQIHGKLRL